MIRWSLALATLAASLSAQIETEPQVETSKPDPRRQAEIAASHGAWHQFLDTQGPGWNVVWNEATETPRAIWGNGLRVAPGSVQTLDDAREYAWETLYRYAGVLRIDPSQFTVEIEAKQARVFVFVFQQYHEGLEVIDGRADVRLHDNGVVSMFGAQAHQISGIATAPVISSQVAIVEAFRARGLAIAETEVAPRLVLIGDMRSRLRSAPRLAWEVVVDREDILVKGKSYIDAMNGAELDWRTDIHHIAAPDVTGNVRGWVNGGLLFSSAPTLRPLENIRVTAPGFTTTFTDANGNFTLVGAGTTANVTVELFGRHADVNDQQAATYSVSQTINGSGTITLSSSAPGENEKAQMSGYQLTDDVNEFIESVIPAFSSQLDQLPVNTNINNNCNAFWNGTSINFYTSGGGCSNTCYSTVVYHEWGHGLDARFGGISQTDGLSEGWGDILATYMTDQPVIGAGFINGNPIRDARNTRTYPPTSCGSSVHCQGEVWMGFAWDLRNNLKASLGNQAGADRANTIVLGSIVADAVNQPDAVLEVFILDDDDGNLNNGTPNYADLAAAATGRALPFPRIQTVDIAHTPLTSTDKPYEARLVSATVTPIQGSITRVRLFSGIAPLLFPKEMVPGPGTNEFRGLVQGYPSPQSVSYYILVDHSSGETKRLPETGWFSYSVGNETVLYSENFEAGGAGWQSGFSRRQNDWQWGAPQGSSGDPGSAYSGTNCWGNDLGPAGWNGEYQPNVTNWLDSPSINCAGQTGVKLRYRRWLTVEDGLYDQATIHVNGTQVWANPVGSGTQHLIDTSWVLHEVDLPQANNNPSVTLQYRLNTDGGLNFGGWNVDDVEVVAASATPPPPVVYEATPPQVSLGSSSTVAITSGAGDLYIAFVDVTPGPFSLPGIGDLQVGSLTTFLASGVLPGSGTESFSIPIPNDQEFYAAEFFSQVLAFDGANFLLSNAQRFLCGG